MNIQDPEALVQCPYDKVHMIRRKRMPYHLQKCRKNYVGRAFKVCPFNARHEVPEPEYQHHLVNCPNKSLVERDMVHMKRLQEDNSYRERYEFGIGSSTSKDEPTNDCNGAGDLAVFQDDLIETFNRTVAVDDDDASPVSSETHQHRVSAQERRRRILYEKRRKNDDLTDTSDYGSDGQVDGFPTADKPKTEPIALKMIRTFGRGTPTEYSNGEKGFGAFVGRDGGGVESQCMRGVGRVGNFGAPFPPSLGRGTMASGIGTSSDSNGELGLSQNWNEIEPDRQRLPLTSCEMIRAKQFEDSPYDPAEAEFRRKDVDFPALDAQRGQTLIQTQGRRDQLAEQQFRHELSFLESDIRQHDYANFPEFQKGFTPRYSSTFGADRPLSKQAQIQLAQQQQQQETFNREPAVNWKKGKRGRGAGRGFLRKSDERQQSVQGFDDGEAMTRCPFGRGVVINDSEYF